MKIGKSLVNWMVSFAESAWSVPALFLFALTEASFFIVPPDVLLIAMCTGRPKKSFYFALICALGSLAGGALGYYIGYAFFDTVGKAIIDALSLADKFQIVGAKYEQNVFWSVFAAAFTPIPYKVFTLAAGFFKVSFASFFLASVIGRSLRFFLVASAIFFFGPSIQKTLEQHFNLFSIVFTLLLIGGFLLIKLL